MTSQRPPRERYGPAVITDQSAFTTMWEPILELMDIDELRQWLDQTSPHHPNPNMAWLYDRILSQMIEVYRTEDRH